MEQKSKKGYAISLDMGTNSIGWAVINQDTLRLEKYKGKEFWGVRLFEKAKDAKDRRTKRTSRNTKQRRNFRLFLLQKELKQEVEKEDKNFFARFKLSQTKKGSCLLFDSCDYTDKKYYQEFPTISHLKVALVQTDKIVEFKKRNLYYRFLFLALHDTLKNRGHFLNENSNVNYDKGVSLEDIKRHINMALKDNPFELNQEEIANTIDNLLRKQVSNNKLSKQEEIVIKLLQGKKTNVQKLINADTKVEIDFSIDEINDIRAKTEPYSALFDSLYNISMECFIYTELQGLHSVSEYKIKLYDQFKTDLSDLKKALKLIDEINKTTYFHDVFVTKDKKTAHFANYIGKTFYLNDKHLTKIARIKREKPQASLKLIIKILNENTTLLYPNYNLFTKYRSQDNKMEYDFTTFLKTPNGIHNRNFSHQIYLNEMQRIIAHASLSQEQKDHLQKLLTFKVDYYVGKLKDDNHWAVKKEGFEDVNVTPYNYDEVIDKNQSNKNFIQKMLRSCTYIEGQNCIQQQTILYQKYLFYNTTNKICIKGELITKDDQQKLFNELAHGKSLSLSCFKSIFGNIQKEDISGVNLENNANKLSLSAVKHFHDLFGNISLDSKHAAFYDDCINGCALLDKKNIQIRYDEIKKIANSKAYINLKITDQTITLLTHHVTNGKWGNLSALFLQKHMFFYDGQSEQSIIDILECSNLQLNEILYQDDLNGVANIDRIDQVNHQHEVNSLIKPQPRYNTQALNQYLKEKFIPPLVRRPIIQAVLLVNEIVIQLKKGELPTNIIMEFTRENEIENKGEATVSRYENLEKIYKKIDKEYQEVKEQLVTQKDNLMSKKLMLYFLQLGKDIYTGEAIKINDLATLYDCDHVHPRSKGGEDSLFDNLVLTRQINNSKKGNDIVPLAWQQKMKGFWQYLHEKKLLSSLKLSRLLRERDYSEQEMQEFVNRQKNVLDWANRETANLFKLIFADKQNSNNFIVYSKAGIVSKVRNQFNLIKCRELNNFHHAHDAYLNYYVATILKEHLNAPTEDNRKTYYPPAIVKYFTTKAQIEYMKKLLQRPDIMVTKKVEINHTGPFWKENPKGKGKKSAKTIDLKRNLCDPKYGQYYEAKLAFRTLLKEGKKIRFEEIKTYECSNFYKNNQFDKELFQEYIKKTRGQKVEILRWQIPIYQPIIYNGVKILLGACKNPGKTIYCHNTNEITLPFEMQHVIKKIIKYLKQAANIKKDKDQNENYRMNFFTTKLKRYFVNEEDYKKKNVNEYIDNIFKTILDKIEKAINNKKLHPSFMRIYSNNFFTQNKFKSLSLYEKGIIIRDLLTIVLNTNVSHAYKHEFIQENSISVIDNDQIVSTKKAKTGEFIFTITCNINKQRIVFITESYTGFIKKEEVI